MSDRPHPSNPSPGPQLDPEKERQLEAARAARLQHARELAEERQAKFRSFAQALGRSDFARIRGLIDPRHRNTFPRALRKLWKFFLPPKD